MGTKDTDPVVQIPRADALELVRLLKKIEDADCAGAAKVSWDTENELKELLWNVLDSALEDV